MNRQQRRKRNKLIKKSKTKQSELNQKLGLFDLIPHDCMICHKDFDKTNKEMVKTWNIVVREKESIVRLYCPECWTKARNLLSELGLEFDEQSG